MIGSSAAALVELLKEQGDVEILNALAVLERAAPEKYAGAQDMWSRATDQTKSSSQQRKGRRVYYMCTNCFVAKTSKIMDVTSNMEPRSISTCLTCGETVHVLVYVASSDLVARVAPITKISVQNDTVSHGRTRAPRLTGRAGTIEGRSARGTQEDLLSRCVRPDYWIAIMSGLPGPMVDKVPTKAWRRKQVDITGVICENFFMVVGNGMKQYIPLYMASRTSNIHGYLTSNEQSLAMDRGTRFLDDNKLFSICNLLGKGANGSVFRATRDIGGAKEVCAIKCHFLESKEAVHIFPETDDKNGTVTRYLGTDMTNAYLCAEGVVGRMAAELLDSMKIEDPTILCPHSLFAIVFPEKKEILICLTMPLMKSSITGLIRQLFTVETRLPFCRIVTQRVLTGLAVLHPAGFCHADIKPDNVLVSKTFFNYGDCTASAKTAVLGDLGLSRWGGSEITGPCMSDEYRPPEAWLELSWGPPADMWGVGCLCMEILLAGKFFIDYEGAGGFIDKKGCKEYLSTICLFFGPIPDNIKTGLTPEALAYAEFASANVKRYGRRDLSIFFPALSGDTPAGSDMAKAIDLIRKLLVLDPRERLTAETALAHPFFTGA